MAVNESKNPFKFKNQIDLGMVDGKPKLSKTFSNLKHDADAQMYMTLLKA